MSALHTHAARRESFRRFARHNPHNGWWRHLPTHMLHVAAAAYAEDCGDENSSRVAMLHAFVTGPLTAERLAVAIERNPMPFGVGYDAIYNADPAQWAAAEVVYASLRTAEYMLDGDRRGALLCCGYARSRAALVVLHVREATTGVPVDLTTGGPDVFPRIDGNARRAFAALRRADVRASIQRRAEVSR